MTASQQTARLSETSSSAPGCLGDAVNIRGLYLVPKPVGSILVEGPAASTSTANHHEIKVANEIRTSFSYLFLAKPSATLRSVPSHLFVSYTYWNGTHIVPERVSILAGRTSLVSTKAQMQQRHRGIRYRIRLVIHLSRACGFSAFPPTRDPRGAE